MRRTTTVITGLIATAALVLAGCGDSSTATGSTSSTSSSTSSSSAAPSTSAGADESSDAGSTSSASGSASELPAAGATATGPIKIGSAGFQESTLIAEMYAGALEAKGITVEKTLNIGQREAYYKGLLDGSIDLIPEYTGNLLGFKDPSTTLTAEADIYAALPAALAPDGLIVLDESEAEDKDSIVVTKETADKYSLTTIADLAAVSGELVFGGPPEFQTRSYGIPGLEKNYGVKFKSYVELDSGGPLSANGLKNGQVDVTDLYTTDPAIPANNFVVLEDPKNNFAAQIIVPLIKNDKATDDVKEALNAVQAKLTTEGLTTLLEQVYSNVAPETVAKQWLSENGIG